MSEARAPTRGPLLALDPSSSATGWAVVDAATARPLAHGLLKPKASLKLPPWDRTLLMAADLTDVVNEHQPSRAVVEITSGKVNRKRHGGGGAGLGVYGMAVGGLAMWCAMTLGPKQVVAIEENEWTSAFPATGRGTTKVDSKTVRQRMAAQVCVTYDPDKDKGQDVSDAIMLGYWLLRMRSSPLAKLMAQT